MYKIIGIPWATKQTPSPKILKVHRFWNNTGSMDPPDGPAAEDPYMHVKVFTVGFVIHNLGDEPPSQYTGSHSQTNRFGPIWSHPRGPFGFPFRTLLDLCSPGPDDLTLEANPPIQLNESNTKWVLFLDNRVAYLPRSKNFQVNTFPASEPVITEHINCGRIAPDWTGAWVVFLHGIYWLPPEPDDTHLAMLMGEPHDELLQFDRDGRRCVNYNYDSANQFFECSLIFIDGSGEMYVESGFYGKGAIKVPESKFIAVIRGSVQPLNHPPFTQWNSLRRAAKAFDAADHSSDTPQQISVAIGEIARDIGRA